MNLRLIFLGTSAAVPTLKRSLPATILQSPTEQWIFDCGENIQRQMIAAKISFHKKTKILLTHLHGDHILGLPGLLQTMTLMDRKNPIQIYGPLGIKDFLVCCQQTLKSELTYQIEINEIIKSGIIVEEEQYFIETTKSNHTIESYSYAFEEKPQPGEFFPEKATALEIPEGELWAKLQKGETITTPKGKTIIPHQVMGPNRQGRKIIYTGDTKPFDTFTTFANNADIIIHDCTFDDTLTTKAELNGHSTSSQAANQAKNSNAKILILTHISARYTYTDILLEQAKKIFKNTLIAEDFYTLNIPTSSTTKDTTNTTPNLNF